MATNAFNLGDNVKAERKLLVTAVNVGTDSAPEWEVIGAGIEDSSVELNPDVSTVTDILGITETTVNKMEPKQSFEPYTIRGGSKLACKLFDIWKRKAWNELANFDVLLIYGFLDGTTSGTFAAEKQTGCTIAINSIGGSATVDMPIEITFSNNSTAGTVNKLKGTGIEFTPAVSA